MVGDSNLILVQTGFALTEPGNPYAELLVARIGVGIRYPDCASTATSCPTDDFWKVRLADVLPKVSPDAVVTDLGVNDTLLVGTLSTPGYAYYGAKIDSLMRLLPAGKPGLWTNLPCSIEGPSRRTGCTVVNSALNLAKARWPNLTVLNWAPVAYNHPEYMLQPGTESPHYSIAGYQAWTKLVLGALDARFPYPA